MTQIFVNILNWIFSWVNNYGWAVIIFTLFVKLVLLPLDIKSRKSMRAMSLLNPQLEVLKKRYANDQEKLNRKTQELYRKEHVNPLSGCLPILIQMPILFIMFAAMRRVAAQQQAKMVLSWLETSGLADFVKAENGAWTVNLHWDKLATVTSEIEKVEHSFGDTQSWLWIKSVFQADNMSRFVIPTVDELKTALSQYGEYLTGDDLLKAKAALEAYVNEASLGREARLELVRALMGSNADEALLESIRTFWESGTNESLEAIKANVQAAMGSDENAAALINYIISPTALEDTTRTALMEYARSFDFADASASYKQQLLYMLDGNTTKMVFGSRIDAALNATVKPYSDKLLGLISITIPTRFNRYINGYFILPILACATQVLASKLQPASATPEPPKDPNGKPQPGSGKIMKWLFPIMSLFICWTSTAAFAIYWVFVNVWSIISSYAINWYLKWSDGRSKDKPQKQDDNNNTNKKEALQP